MNFDVTMSATGGISGQGIPLSVPAKATFSGNAVAFVAIGITFGTNCARLQDKSIAHLQQMQTRVK